ncbi:MAG: ABC transporter permease, partial [Gammaproteobacteria bacterium]|nr:ABC transporter permease [Gammaproteobacteria bacterium]
TLILLLLVLGAAFLGFPILPADPLMAIHLWLAIWLMGAGFGLMASVGATLVEEIARIVSILMFPLYFLSGVIVPVTFLPHAVQEWLLLNPMLHGVELFRLAFFPAYHTLQGISLPYLYLWSCGSFLRGLLLQVRFARRLTAQ